MTVEVLHASAWYPPHQMGGTEVYISGLVKGLADLGVNSALLVPRASGVPERYRHEGAEVLTFPPKATGETESLRQFADRLKAHPGAVYHQHSWTPDCGADHLRIARAQGMTTVLTLHVPSSLCLRGTMMRLGKDACEGRIDEHACAECWAQERGAFPPVATALSWTPMALSDLAGRLPSRVGTALGARAMARRRKSDFSRMIDNADHVVAVCRWLYDALALNGAPADKLSLSRQGVAADFLQTARTGRAHRPAHRAGEPIRLLYLGRWSPVKGIDTGVAGDLEPAGFSGHARHPRDRPGGRGNDLSRANSKAGQDDPRIRLREPVARDQIVATLQAHDALLVPSVCLETGPMVVLEAMAAGLFVLGSRLGGIAELIEGDDGVLLPPHDVEAWANAIAELERHPARAAAPRNVRTMDDAAAEMSDVYRKLAVRRAGAR